MSALTSGYYGGEWDDEEESTNKYRMDRIAKFEELFKEYVGRWYINTNYNYSYPKVKICDFYMLDISIHSGTIPMFKCKMISFPDTPYNTNQDVDAISFLKQIARGEYKRIYSERLILLSELAIL